MNRREKIVLAFLAGLLAVGLAISYTRQQVASRRLAAFHFEPLPAATVLLDLNRADAAALERLDGVGPVLAARIVAYRTSHGPFRAVAELRRVKGIGAHKLAALAQQVEIHP